MRSERTYLTFDQALKLMQIIETQDFWMVEQTDERNRFLLDNCQVVYSGCGQCGCDDRSDFKEEPKPTTTYVCRKGTGTYPDDWPTEWTPLTQANEGSLKGQLWMIKDDGKGKITETLVGANSTKCTVDVPEVTAVYITYAIGEASHSFIEARDLETGVKLDFIPFRNYPDLSDSSLHITLRPVFHKLLPLANGNIGFILNRSVSLSPGSDGSPYIYSGIFDSAGNLIDYTEWNVFVNGTGLWFGKLDGPSNESAGIS